MLFIFSDAAIIFYFYCKVNVYKPVSSKAGNSEQYIVCVGFKGRSVITDVHLNKLKQGFSKKYLLLLCYNIER